MSRRDISHPFKVIEQARSSATYDLHLFEDEQHFQAWQIVYRRSNMRPAANGFSGRLRLQVDHRWESDIRVDAARDELEYGTLPQKTTRPRAERAKLAREAVERFDRPAPEEFDQTTTVKVRGSRAFRRYGQLVIGVGDRIGVVHPHGIVVPAVVVSMADDKIEIEIGPCSLYKRGRRVPVNMADSSAIGLNISKIVSVEAAAA